MFVPPDTPTFTYTEPFVHVLTHKDLHLHPVSATVRARAMASRDGRWIAPGELGRLGLPAPVRRLLAEVEFPVPLEGDPAFVE